jgi:hypothetical protein
MTVNSLVYESFKLPSEDIYTPMMTSLDLIRSTIKQLVLLLASSILIRLDHAFGRIQAWPDEYLPLRLFLVAEVQ